MLLYYNFLNLLILYKKYFILDKSEILGIVAYIKEHCRHPFKLWSTIECAAAILVVHEIATTVAAAFTDKYHYMKV